MRQLQFGLASLLLIAMACPIWLWLIVFLPESPGWGGHPMRFIMPSLVLCGVTVALHRLLRQHRNAWALSALLAGLIVMGILFLIAALAG